MQPTRIIETHLAAGGLMRTSRHTRDINHSFCECPDKTLPSFHFILPPPSSQTPKRPPLPALCPSTAAAGSNTRTSNTSCHLDGCVIWNKLFL